MIRTCGHCHQQLQRGDFVKEESKSMEAERKALGLAGVHFFEYRCPACGYKDIFVDLRRLQGETDEAFDARRTELQDAIRELHAEQAEVVIVER
jgi:hypothetical protein